MFNAKQQSVALDAIISFRANSEQIAAVQDQTGLDRAQAERLVEQMKFTKGTRAGEIRTFFAVASSIGEDMARYTYMGQAHLAAAVFVFGFVLLYSNQVFLGFVCFGLAIANTTNVVQGLRRLHRSEAEKVAGQLDSAQRGASAEAPRPQASNSEATEVAPKSRLRPSWFGRKAA